VLAKSATFWGGINLVRSTVAFKEVEVERAEAVGTKLTTEGNAQAARKRGKENFMMAEWMIGSLSYLLEKNIITPVLSSHNPSIVENTKKRS
jgi:hypothetical protein